MNLFTALGATLFATAFALSPAMAEHPGQDADGATERSSDADHKNCEHYSESEEAQHKDHADHEHDKSSDSEGHDHHCEDDASR